MITRPTLTKGKPCDFTPIRGEKSTGKNDNISPFNTWWEWTLEYLESSERQNLHICPMWSSKKKKIIKRNENMFLLIYIVIKSCSRNKKIILPTPKMTIGTWIFHFSKSPVVTQRRSPTQKKIKLLFLTRWHLKKWIMTAKKKFWRHPLTSVSFILLNKKKNN